MKCKIDTLGPTRNRPPSRSQKGPTALPKPSPDPIFQRSIDRSSKQPSSQLPTHQKINSREARNGKSVAESGIECIGSRLASERGGAAGCGVAGIDGSLGGPAPVVERLACGSRVILAFLRFCVKLNRGMEDDKTYR